MEGIFLEQGTLVFRIYTSNAYLPIEGATVTVTTDSAPQKLLALRITDKSGETEPVVISTPNRSESQSPDGTIQPWTNVTVRVEHPEFERVTLKGVQIFPGITSIQNIQLVPLLEFDPENSGAIQQQFTPQPIWEKYYE